MGIAGAGNSGTLIATLFALASRRNLATPILLLLPCSRFCWSFSFSPSCKDSQDKEKRRQWRDFASVLRESDTACSVSSTVSLRWFRRARQLPHCFLS